MPLSAWRVVAGTEISSNPWQSILDGAGARLETKKAATGDLIRPPRFCSQRGGRLPVWIKGKAFPSNRQRCPSCSSRKPARKRA